MCLSLFVFWRLFQWKIVLLEGIKALGQKGTKGFCADCNKQTNSIFQMEDASAADCTNPSQIGDATVGRVLPDNNLTVPTDCVTEPCNNYCWHGNANLRLPTFKLQVLGAKNCLLACQGNCPPTEFLSFEPQVLSKKFCLPPLREGMQPCQQKDCDLFTFNLLRHFIAILKQFLSGKTRPTFFITTSLRHSVTITYIQ